MSEACCWNGAMTATVNGGSGPDGPGERGPMKAGGTAPSVAPDAVQEALDAAAASPSSAVSGEEPESWPAGGEGAARRFASGHPMLTGSLVLEDVMALPQGQLVEALELLERVLSWARAQQARGIHRLQQLVEDELSFFDRTDPQLAFRAAASEVGALLCLPPLTAQRLMAESQTLAADCPETLARLEDGRLTYGQAQAIARVVAGLGGEDRERVEQMMLGKAKDLTPAQLERIGRRHRDALLTEAQLARQHRQARAERSVWLRPEPEGMVQLSAFLPAAQGQGIYGMLTTAARGEQAAGDPRTLNQLRADIFAALLTGDPECSPPVEGAGRSDGQEHPGARPGPTAARPTGGTRCEVMVLLTAETLLGLSGQPAELNGYGSISPEAARALVESASHLTALLTDSLHGEVLAVGARRRVPDSVKRWLQARDGTCRFPGCSAGTVAAEIDHTVPYAQGGSTDHRNLACLCRKHHRLKTLGFWRARQPEPGYLVWTSPTGRTYLTEPQLILQRGREEPEPAPF